MIGHIAEESQDVFVSQNVFREPHHSLLKLKSVFIFAVKFW